MTEEQLQELMDGFSSLKSRADKEDVAKAEAADAEDQAAWKNKFGHMYTDPETNEPNADIGGLIRSTLKGRGASVESATEEAIRDMLLPLLEDTLKPMMRSISGLVKSVTNEIKDQMKDVVEGPVAGEELDVPPMDEGAMPPPDMGAEPSPPPPDAGMSPPDMGAPPLMPSDERLKNIRPALLSDERFKKLTLSDAKLKVLEKFSAMPETVLSSEDLKDIVFMDEKGGAGCEDCNEEGSEDFEQIIQEGLEDGSTIEQLEELYKNMAGSDDPKREAGLLAALAKMKAGSKKPEDIDFGSLTQSPDDDLLASLYGKNDISKVLKGLKV